MKITKNQIRRIIREEKRALLKESQAHPRISSRDHAVGIGFGSWQANKNADFAKSYGREAFTVNDHRRDQLVRESEAVDEIDLENPSGANGDHHWPRVEWDNIYDLVDKWAKMEEDSFDVGDPSMTKDDELSQSEAKAYWAEQVEAASIELESELTQAVRKAALATMKSISDRLINGDFA